MQRLVLLFAVAILLALPTVASADTVTFQAPATAATSSSPNQFNLDHHDAYTWRIGGVDLTGKTITSATLTFRNISNWDSSANMLFIHLLDTAKSFSTASGTRSATVNGVTSFQDAPANQVPVTAINDDFAGSSFLNNPLVDPNTANTFLAQQSFTTTATNFVYTFTADQLQILSAYFMNGGDIAFGFDPDCHFWNNGITFTFTTCPTTPTPEPATLALLGTGLAGLYYRRRRQQKKAHSIN